MHVIIGAGHASTCRLLQQDTFEPAYLQVIPVCRRYQVLVRHTVQVNRSFHQLLKLAQVLLVMGNCQGFTVPEAQFQII